MSTIQPAGRSSCCCQLTGTTSTHDVATFFHILTRRVGASVDGDYAAIRVWPSCYSIVNAYFWKHLLKRVQGQTVLRQKQRFNTMLLRTNGTIDEVVGAFEFLFGSTSVFWGRPMLRYHEGPFWCLFMPWLGVSHASDRRVPCGHRLSFRSFSLRFRYKSPGVVLSVTYRVIGASTFNMMVWLCDGIIVW